MKNFFVTAFTFLLLTYQSNSQSIELLRTDVDSSRSDFVTATYIFGIDVQITDIEGCTGAAFELHYNQIDYVAFSEWRLVDFPDDALAVVLPRIDRAAGTGIVSVGALSGQTVQDTGYTDPKVIHLEFAVSQSAPHNEPLTLTFVNTRAVTASDTGGAIIDIDTEPFEFTIHSFIQVWPGDADNNGVVNTNDYTNIMQYLGIGSSTKKFRSFKRYQPSTYWSGQRCLAWDNKDITYADCDGNGDITMLDALIVGLNFAKEHPLSAAEKTGGSDKTASLKMPPEEQFSADNTIAIPIRVGHSSSYIGACGEISWSHFPEDVNVLGLERGDLFLDRNSSYFLSKADIENQSAEIAFGTVDRDIAASEPGVLAYLIVEAPGDYYLPNPQINDLYGLSPHGMFFPLGLMTSIDSDQTIFENINISVTGNGLTITSDNTLLQTVKIYDLYGSQVIHSGAVDSQRAHINISGLSNGVYFAVIQADDRFIRRKILITR